MFQGTQAFQSFFSASQPATKLQVQGEQQMSVSVFKHGLCIRFSYQTLNSSVFPAAQKGCTSVDVREGRGGGEGLRL